MIFYDPKAEKIATIEEPSYSEITDNSGSVRTHSFTAIINFEYQNNPIDPKTRQYQKDTFKSISDNYPAKKDSKEKAENFFRQLCIRSLGSNIRKIDEQEAKKIRNSW